VLPIKSQAHRVSFTGYTLNVFAQVVRDDLGPLIFIIQAIWIPKGVGTRIWESEPQTQQSPSASEVNIQSGITPVNEEGVFIVAAFLADVIVYACEIRRQSTHISFPGALDLSHIQTRDFARPNDQNVPAVRECYFAVRPPRSFGELLEQL
jgi:hypothetical protein